MAAHVGNAVAKPTPLGDLVSKDKKGSPRKIDAAVAGIVAYDRAAWHVAKRGSRGERRAVVLVSHHIDAGGTPQGDDDPGPTNHLLGGELGILTFSQ